MVNFMQNEICDSMQFRLDAIRYLRSHCDGIALVCDGLDIILQIEIITTWLAQNTKA